MQDKKEYKKTYYKENKEKIKKYREDNKEYISETKKQYYLENKEIIRLKRKEARERKKEENKNIKEEKKKLNAEKRKEYLKNYQLTYKEKRNKERKERRDSEPLYKLTMNIRKIVSSSLRSKGYKKESRTYEVLGCSYEELKQHLENQFINNNSWMNWENYGNPKDGLIEPNKTWDIDHIIPLVSATNEEEVIKLNHYTNLQPLCSYNNRFIKKDNY